MIPSQSKKRITLLSAVMVLSMIAAGAVLAAPATAQTLDTTEVGIDGSTVTVDNSAGTTSFAVTGIPSDVAVSNAEPGLYDSGAGEILIGGPTSPAPETYEFTLNPNSSAYSDGDTFNITVDGDAQTITVTEVTVPPEFGDSYGSVSSESYEAVLDGEEGLGAGNLAGAIQSWSGDDGSEQGSVSGTDVGAGELSAMINYWSQEIAGSSQ